MERSEFRDLVLTTLEPHGAPYANESEVQNTIINRRLRMYSELTRCLYDDAVPFTLEADEPLYDLLGSAFTKDMARIDSIWINGTPLKNYQGQDGPCTLAELRQWESNYLVAASAAPTKWAAIAAQTIRIFPPPDQVYSNCFAQGYPLHSEIDPTDAGDTEQIEIPDPYQSNSAVYWCVVGFLRINASVNADFELMRGLSESAWAEMEGLREKSRAMHDGALIRGGRMGSGVHRLQ